MALPATSPGCLAIRIDASTIGCDNAVASLIRKMPMRVISFLYGVFVYLIAFAAFCYLIGFMGNFAVPKSIDSGATESIPLALLINTMLLAIFAVQHSVMARPWFKAWWTKLIPTPVERSTYVLFTSLALILIYWKWAAMPQLVWNAPSGIMRDLIWGIFGLGWLTV